MHTHNIIAVCFYNTKWDCSLVLLILRWAFFFGVSFLVGIPVFIVKYAPYPRHNVFYDNVTHSSTSWPYLGQGPTLQNLILFLLSTFIQVNGHSIIHTLNDAYLYSDSKYCPPVLSRYTLKIMYTHLIYVYTLNNAHPPYLCLYFK